MDNRKRAHSPHSCSTVSSKQNTNNVNNNNNYYSSEEETEDLNEEIKKAMENLLSAVVILVDSDNCNNNGQCYGLERSQPFLPDSSKLQPQQASGTSQIPIAKSSIPTGISPSEFLLLRQVELKEYFYKSSSNPELRKVDSSAEAQLSSLAKTGIMPISNATESTSEEPIIFIYGPQEIENFLDDTLSCLSISEISDDPTSRIETNQAQAKNPIAQTHLGGSLQFVGNFSDEEISETALADRQTRLDAVKESYSYPCFEHPEIVDFTSTLAFYIKLSDDERSGGEESEYTQDWNKYPSHVREFNNGRSSNETSLRPQMVSIGINVEEPELLAEMEAGREEVTDTDTIGNVAVEEEVAESRNVVMDEDVGVPPELNTEERGGNGESGAAPSQIFVIVPRDDSVVAMAGSDTPETGSSTTTSEEQDYRPSSQITCHHGFHREVRKLRRRVCQPIYQMRISEALYRYGPYFRFYGEPPHDDCNSFQAQSSRENFSTSFPNFKEPDGQITTSMRNISAATLTCSTMTNEEIQTRSLGSNEPECNHSGHNSPTAPEKANLYSYDSINSGSTANTVNMLSSYHENPGCCYLLKHSDTTSTNHELSRPKPMSSLERIRAHLFLNVRVVHADDARPSSRRPRSPFDRAVITGENNFNNRFVIRSDSETNASIFDSQEDITTSDNDNEAPVSILRQAGMLRHSNHDYQPVRVHWMNHNHGSEWLPDLTEDEESVQDVVVRDGTGHAADDENSDHDPNDVQILPHRFPPVFPLFANLQDDSSSSSSEHSVSDAAGDADASDLSSSSSSSSAASIQQGSASTTVPRSLNVMGEDENQSSSGSAPNVLAKLIIEDGTSSTTEESETEEPSTITLKKSKFSEKLYLVRPRPFIGHRFVISSFGWVGRKMAQSVQPTWLPKYSQRIESILSQYVQRREATENVDQLTTTQPPSGRKGSLQDADTNATHHHRPPSSSTPEMVKNKLVETLRPLNSCSELNANNIQISAQNEGAQVCTSATRLLLLPEGEDKRPEEDAVVVGVNGPEKTKKRCIVVGWFKIFRCPKCLRGQIPPSDSEN